MRTNKTIPVYDLDNETSDLQYGTCVICNEFKRVHNLATNFFIPPLFICDECWSHDEEQIETLELMAQERIANFFSNRNFVNEGVSVFTEIDGNVKIGKKIKLPFDFQVSGNVNDDVFTMRFDATNWDEFVLKVSKINKDMNINAIAVLRGTEWRIVCENK